MNFIKRIAYNRIIPAFGWMMIRENHYCNVIYYHDIVEGTGRSYMQTNIDLFKKQMNYLANNGYETLRFDDFSTKDNLRFRKKRVLIAFDDGWLSNYNEIFGFMKSLGLKYNVFLAVGLIGHDTRYLTWNMVREMHQSGLCGFGTHTYSHVDASVLDESLYLEEIKKTDTVFEHELGYVPKDFCYPYGKYTQKSNETLIENSGYERIYLSDMRYSYEQSRKTIMGRNGISNDEPFFVFKNKVKGYYNIFSSLS